MDVYILRGRASEAGFLLLSNSIADDVAHDTKNGSIARAHERINSNGNILDRRCFI